MMDTKITAGKASRKSKVWLVLGAILLCAMASIFIFQKQIGTMIFDRAVEQMGRDIVSDLNDNLHVGLCGTGSPLPNPDRAGPCNIVIAGEQVFVVDIGEGGGRNINLMGIPASRVTGVLLTHFHSDHIDGLGPLMLFHWTQSGATRPLPIHGPQGVEAVVDGFNAAYATDKIYRTTHHGEKVAPTSGGGGEARPFSMNRETQIVLERDGLKITAFKVDHDPVDPAVGYRFDYKGRSIVISGDTAKSASLERAAKGADLLIHEALATQMVEQMTAIAKKREMANFVTITQDILEYHASPEDAAESAQAAGVQTLVLSHLIPPLPSSYLYPAFLADAPDKFSGEIIVGEDGMFFSLPSGSDAIEQSNLK